MTSSSSSEFAVLLARPEGSSTMAIAKVLAAVRKTPLQDQILAAKSAWGILAEHAAPSEAAALAQALNTAQIPSLACPQTALAALPPPEMIRTAAAIPSEPPDILAAAAIKFTTTTTHTVHEGPTTGQKLASAGIFLTTGLPIKIGGKSREVEKSRQQSDFLYYLDFIYRETGKRVRMEGQDFDYSFLNERKLYQMLGNFKLVLQDQARRAPNAWENQGTRVFLNGTPLAAMGYESVLDFERESRWLLTLRGLPRPN